MSQEQYIGLHTLIDLANIQSPERVIQVTHMPFYEGLEVAVVYCAQADVTAFFYY
jgi:hypothetical protein